MRESRFIPEFGDNPSYAGDGDRAALALAESVIDLPPAARAAHLDSACADSPFLRARVESLLDACENPNSTQNPLPWMILPEQWAASVAAPFTSQGAPACNRTRLSAGEMFGKYRIVRFIAAGGMGEVYEALEEGVDRRVAIKVLAAHASPARSRRFEHEANLMARLEHPHLARLYEWGTATHGGTPAPYIAMEFVQGRPITSAAAALGDDPRDRVELFIQVCDAVGYAHTRGVIHRDLKPANILVDEQNQVRVLDFGIGSLVDLHQRARLTLTAGGPRPGTLAYMSPEQLRGGADSISTLSDVYSLGLVLYEVLAGRPAVLFRDEPIDAVIRAVLEEDPPSLARVNPRCKGDLEAITSAAIRKEPGARYPSAAALGADLSRVLRHEPITVRKLGPAERVRKFVRRHRAWSAAILATALALTAGLAIAAWQYQRAVDAERVAQVRLNEARSLARTLLFDFSEAIESLPGTAPVRAMLAERATGALAPLAEGSQDPDLLIDLAEGYSKLARIAGVPTGPNLNQFSRAKELLTVAEATARRATELRPEDVRGWMVLGSVYGGMGGAADKDTYSDCLRRAVESYTKAFELCGSRLDTPQGKAAAQLVAYYTAYWAGTLSGPDGPSDKYQASFDLYDRLIAQYPGEALLVQSRAVVLRSYASLLPKIRPAEARRALEEAAGVFERLLADDPTEYSSIRHLSRCQVDLAYLLCDEGRFAEAISLMDQAAEPMRRGSLGEPTNSFRRDDRLDSETWRASVRLLAARSPATPPAEGARYLTEAIGWLEAAIAERKTDLTDPSPRDQFRMERLESLLTESKALLAERHEVAPTK